MKVESKPLPRQRLRAFAVEHGLTLEIVERSREYYHADGDFANNRWYAHFQCCETSDGVFLLSVTGNGPTPAKAVRDYARKISEKKLIVDAYTSERKEIHVPVLYV